LSGVHGVNRRESADILVVSALSSDVSEGACLQLSSAEKGEVQPAANIKFSVGQFCWTSNPYRLKEALDLRSCVVKNA